MASNEARAAAMAAAEATPIVTIEQAAPAAPAPETPVAPTQPAPGTAPTPPTPEGEPAPAKPAEGGEDAPRSVTFADWQSLKHKTKKVQEREARASQAIAEAEQAKKDADAAREHPAVKLFGQKGDVASVVRGYAEAHGLTYQKALEILSHQTMNDGAIPQDAALKASLDPVQAKLAEIEKAQKALDERLASERAETEKRGTSQAFVNWSTSEEVAKKYPVMSAEDPADIAEASWQLAQGYREANAGQWPSREWVAGELEKAARAFYGAKVKVFERFKSATDTGTPNKPATEGTRDPASPGGGAQARTLSNKSASERSSGLRENATREERRAVARRLLG